MYQQYCFRRAICSPGQQVTDVTSAGLFKLINVLVSIDTNSYRSIVSQYGSSVLGYFIDEPSGTTGEGGYIPPATMSNIKADMVSSHSKLYLDDYDTSPIPSNENLGIPHNYHIANRSVLSYGDYIWNDGNTSKWVSGANLFGIDVLSLDYVEFQGWFGNNFNAIVCKPMDGNGALMNDGLMSYWLQNYSNCNNFVLYLNPKLAGAWSAALNNFLNDANNAGFLGHQYQAYNYTYVCQQNGVNFTPPNCPTPPAQNTVGAGGSAYWGVWTNNSYYRGPVDPSTPGATICWVLQSTAATSQTVNVY